MEKRLSQNELQKFYNEQIRERGAPELVRSVEEARVGKENIKNRKSIFLCHSHFDKTIVNKIVLLFNKINCDIYVDWMDNTMPKVTDRQTATIIHKKIVQCNKFLFLATARGLKSKWCDWELGIAYSLKKETEIAILPIESKSGKWDGSEYLNLFPEMELDTANLNQISSNDIKIILGKERAFLFEEWLLIKD